MQSLRFGVLGAANIARRFVAGVRPSDHVSVHAIASRTSAKAAAFAEEVGVAQSYGSYDALLADPEIDAIYIPLPNALHAEWALRSLKAGKHVLCEKPLGLTESDVRGMFDCARTAGRVLVEGYPYLSQPQTIRLRDLIRNGDLGRLRMIQAAFGFTLRDPTNVRFDPDLGGGAMLDAGSYPVSLVCALTGLRPARVTAGSLMRDGVDLTTWSTLEFADGLIAQLFCSFDATFHRQALVVGDHGAARTTYLNHPPIGGPAVLEIRRDVAFPSADKPDAFESLPVEGGDGFLAEAESFAARVRGDNAAWTGATERDSINIAVVLDAIRESVRIGRAVELSPQSNL